MSAPEITEAKYPEHEKLRAIKDQSQVCGEFLAWMQSRGFVLCRPMRRWPDGEYAPAPIRTQEWLAAFFDIDEEALEAEKRAMLDEIRAGDADMLREVQAAIAKAEVRS